MGQTFSNILGSLIFFILKLSEKAQQLISGEKKEKNYYNNDILLKDEEQHADILSSEEINKLIKKQQNMKKNSPDSVNMNEYKMIKNTVEMDEPDTFITPSDKNVSVNSSDPLPSQEIHDFHKEVINLHVEDHVEDDEQMSTENIEDLKASILNHDD